MRTAFSRKAVLNFVAEKHRFMEDSAVQLSTMGNPVWRVRPMGVGEHICRHFSTVQNNLVCYRLASSTEVKVAILPRPVNWVTFARATLLSTVYAASYSGMFGHSSDSDSDEEVWRVRPMGVGEHICRHFSTVQNNLVCYRLASSTEVKVAILPRPVNQLIVACSATHQILIVDEEEEARADIHLMNKTILTVGEQRRLDILRTEQVKLIPLYVARMTYTSVDYNKMFFHVRFTEEHLVPYVGTTPGEFLIKDAYTGDVGTIRMSIGLAGHALVSGGWKQFAQEHHYIEGRVCVFIFDEVDGAMEVKVERF